MYASASTITPDGRPAAHLVHQHLADEILEDLERRPGVERLGQEPDYGSSFQTRDRVRGRASDPFVPVARNGSSQPIRSRVPRNPIRWTRSARCAICLRDLERRRIPRAGPANLQQIVARLRAVVPQDEMRGEHVRLWLVRADRRRTPRPAGRRPRDRASEGLQRFQRLAVRRRPRPSAAARRIRRIRSARRFRNSSRTARAPSAQARAAPVRVALDPGDQLEDLRRAVLRATSPALPRRTAGRTGSSPPATPAAGRGLGGARRPRTRAVAARMIGS